MHWPIGSVHLRHYLVMKIYKKIKPIDNIVLICTSFFYMESNHRNFLQFYLLSIALFFQWYFSNKGNDCDEAIFKKLQAGGYQVPPSIETECRPWTLINPEINRSAMNMILSLDRVVPMISLLSNSIAETHHNQINSEPTLIKVSSFCIQEYSAILFLFVETFLGLYFWIQFHFEYRNRISFDRTR